MDYGFWSFFKLLEVGVLFYFFYTLFKCFVMFELIEAVRARLIGPKSWNRSVEIFGEFLRPICAIRTVLGTVLGVWMIIY